MKDKKLRGAGGDVIQSHVPTVGHTTELLALSLVCRARNSNAEPQHMRLKRRALHPQQGSSSIGTGDDPAGLLKSGQNLRSLGVLEHASHLPGILGRTAAVRGFH